MAELVGAIAGVLLGLGGGAFIVQRLLGSRLRQADAELIALREEKSTLAVRLATREGELTAERSRYAEHQAALESARAALAETFGALSADALARNNQTFLDLARATLDTQQQAARAELDKRQQAVGELIAPVRASLEQFAQQVHSLEVSRVNAYATLSEQVRALAEVQVQLRAETGNLVKALLAPQTRGRWGELQLRRVVEMAGMLDHCDFFEQETANTEEGRLRPDMVVKLPGGRHIVVDAKAPLAAYLEALEAGDEESRRLRLADHARQVRDHLVKLGRKAYWEQFQPSPDFVVLFLPGETFYAAALEADPALIEQGVEQRVILATPTTLIALLRAVAYGWNQQDMAENAERIGALGRELYDRIGTLAEHWHRVGRNLGEAVSAYNKSVASLESRVLVSARRFRELKAGSEEREIAALAPVESLPREIQSAELVPNGDRLTS